MDLKFIQPEQEAFLRKKHYIRSNETVEDRYYEIVERVRYYESEGYPEGLADRVQRYLFEGILSPSTPVLANFGRKKEKGSTPLPVSCNIIGVENSIQGIYGANLEAAMLSKLGAGVGIDFTNVFEEGTQIAEDFFTNPKMDWIEAIIDTTQKVSQNSVRRGYGVPFINILDKEFFTLLKRIDKNNPNEFDTMVDNNVGIVIPTGFMSEMLGGNKEYQKRWYELLKTRKKSGQAYILFEENCNKNQSEVYKRLGHSVNQTNICTEALVPYYSDKTFACVLSALNLVHWDIIKRDPQIIKDCFTFLDIINEEYIWLSKGIVGLDKARRSALEKRDIGLGTLGFHTYLQSKNIEFGSLECRYLNKEIYKTIQKYCKQATETLADLLGPAPMCEEAGLNWRNVSWMMVAPNKSTSFICGAVSPGIEAIMSNVFSKNLAGIQYIFKNTHLQEILERLGKNNSNVWESISENLGSVQHLDFLDEQTKKVFKTFSEISPKDMIDLNADRQEFIDMGQSFNLMFRPNYSMKDIHEIHLYCFNKGVKTLYYAYPQAHATIEQDGESWDACASCAD